jgi:hypothetical protein
MTANYIPARIPFIDARSGLVSREWYLFFQNLMDPSSSADADDQSLFDGGGALALAGGDPASDESGLAALLAIAGVDGAEELASPYQIPVNITLGELIALLGYTPANKAGDTFTGAVVVSAALTANTMTATAAGGVTAPLLVSTGGMTAGSLPVYANEAAALAGGLTHGQIYQTATGELRIKL